MTIENKDVYAAATEDMDTLTFGTKILIRGFNSKKEPVTEINYDLMLKGIIQKIYKIKRVKLLKLKSIL